VSRRSYDLLTLSVISVGLGMGLVLAAMSIIQPLEVIPISVAVVGGSYVPLSDVQKREYREFTTLSLGICFF